MLSVFRHYYAVVLVLTQVTVSENIWWLIQHQCYERPPSTAIARDVSEGSMLSVLHVTRFFALNATMLRFFHQLWHHACQGSVVTSAVGKKRCV